VPSIFIAMFFFLVNIGTLDELTSQIPGFDYPSFQLPTSVLLGVTGVTRAYAFVIDIQDGYFDRLLVTPVRRLAIRTPTTNPRIRIALRGRAARRAGVHRHLLAVVPGLRRLRLRHRPQDRQPGGGAVELPVVLPVPVPHLVVRTERAALEGQRSLIFEGWVWTDLGKALLAIALVGSVSMTLCFAALRGRIKKR
jgi:ABC-2 type transport system permease protein